MRQPSPKTYPNRESASMAPMKLNESRRVWRMTSDSPLGEYLELVPKRAYASNPEHQEVSLRTASQGPAKPATGTFRRDTPESHSAAPCNRQAAPVPSAPASKVKVLRPAQVESWQSSSFDLMSGLQVRDVSDTIPGRVFEELFKAIPSTVFTKRRC